MEFEDIPESQASQQPPHIAQWRSNLVRVRVLRSRQLWPPCPGNMTTTVWDYSVLIRIEYRRLYLSERTWVSNIPRIVCFGGSPKEGFLDAEHIISRSNYGWREVAILRSLWRWGACHCASRPEADNTRNCRPDYCHSQYEVGCVGWRVHWSSKTALYKSHESWESGLPRDSLVLLRWWVSLRLSRI